MKQCLLLRCRRRQESRRRRLVAMLRFRRAREELRQAVMAAKGFCERRGISMESDAPQDQRRPRRSIFEATERRWHASRNESVEVWMQRRHEKLQIECSADVEEPVRVVMRSLGLHRGQQTAQWQWLSATNRRGPRRHECVVGKRSKADCRGEDGCARRAGVRRSGEACTSRHTAPLCSTPLDRVQAREKRRR